MKIRLLLVAPFVVLACAGSEDLSARNDGTSQSAGSTAAGAGGSAGAGAAGKASGGMTGVAGFPNGNGGKAGGGAAGAGGSGAGGAAAGMGGASAGTAGTGGASLVDDALITSDAFPGQMGCGQTITVTVTAQNNGTSTWTKAGGYRLGAVSGSDPLSKTARYDLGDADSVPPGGTFDFALTLTAPAAADKPTSTWRMLREPAQWFGQTNARTVNVSCTAAPPFDLSKVTIIGSPDVRGFPVTSKLTSLSFSPGTIHVDHEKRGQWPPVVIADDGTTQEATIWVFFAIDGAWYATGGERLRPNQTDKQLDNPSKIGPGWLYDSNRWGVMTNYVPQAGDLVGFMVVAGSTRSDNHVIVEERTGVVLVNFPADGQSTSFPPFAYQE